MTAQIELEWSFVPYKTTELEVVALAPFGVEVRADLSRPLTYELQKHFRSLVFDHGLVLARRQALTTEQQRQLVACLGPSPNTSWHVGQISNVGANQRLGNQELRFHSDLAFTKEPVIVISLLALNVVDGRTSTKFVNCGAALQRMPLELKKEVESCSARFGFPLNQAARYLGHEIIDGLPQHTWPVVLSHPVTGAQLLFVNEMQTSLIEGLASEASATLLVQIFDHLYDGSNMYEHKWFNGDLLVWDNIALQHARGELSPSDTRVLRRVIASIHTFAELCPQFQLDDPRWIDWLNHASDEDPKTQLLRILASSEK